MAAMVSTELVTAFESIGLNVTGFVVTDIMDSVTTFAVGTTVVGTIMLTLTYASIFLFNYTSQKQIFRVRTMYFRSILHQDISWYDVMNSGDVASRLTEYVQCLFIQFFNSRSGSYYYRTVQLINRTSFKFETHKSSYLKNYTNLYPKTIRFYLYAPYFVRWKFLVAVRI